MDFLITIEHQGQRLDKFLKEYLPEFSRAHLQRMVKDGQVTVNSKRITPHHFLRMGDEVEAVIEPPEDLRVVPNPEVQIVNCTPTPPYLPSGRGGKIVSPPLGGGVRGGLAWVLHEEPDFIVVNKPAGLVVHQGAGHKAPDTLVNGLLARYPELGKVGDDPIRPGIAHRLDADVSGVMVIARTQDMFDHLKKQFKMHEVEKEYVAAVNGAVIPPQGVIEFVVARKGARMVARPKGGKGRQAVTEYETIPLPRWEGMKGRVTFLAIRTRTGRTHQIRVHLKAIGHPIVGDTLYRSKSSKSSETGKSSRLMLHARKIAFKDLSGTRREFVCPEPEEFLL
ncbi:RluA family pseudouridine synthase [Candidatus Uhrbacteria bacterium]|nr:RluA family pseudouridine synthase [Candidatus Uhrbacteria bacterium]